jgi:hypothetical protein
MLFSFTGFVTGYSNLLVLPLVYFTVQIPRKWSVMQHFTYHAELLPHTEQVVFHKAGLFGSIRRIIVDIKNLEKIEADQVPGKYIDKLFNLTIHAYKECAI